MIRKVRLFYYFIIIFYTFYINSIALKSLLILLTPPPYYIPHLSRTLGKLFPLKSLLRFPIRRKVSAHYGRITLPIGRLLCFCDKCPLVDIGSVFLKLSHRLHTERFPRLIIFSSMFPYFTTCAIYGDMFFVILLLFLCILTFWYVPPFVLLSRLIEAFRLYMSKDLVPPISTPFKVTF